MNDDRKIMESLCLRCRRTHQYFRAVCTPSSFVRRALVTAISWTA